MGKIMELNDFEYLCYFNLNVDHSDKFFYLIFPNENLMQTDVDVWLPFEKELKKLKKDYFDNLELCLKRRDYLLNLLTNLKKEITFEKSYEKRRQKANAKIVSQKNSVLKLHGNKCLCCGSIEKISIDHIIPVKKGGSNKLDNLQPLCVKCNSKKGTKIIDYRNNKKK